MTYTSVATSKSLIEQYLPAYGQPRKRMPVWDEGQKMFICDEHESAKGFRYYCGARFCNNLAVIEKVGLYHNWTYIDSIELYAFNGQKMELIQKRDYEKKIRSEAFVREETEEMLKDYLRGVSKVRGLVVSAETLNANARGMVEDCYKSFLDRDYALPMQMILRQIEEK